MYNVYVVNKDGFLVDPETGEVIDELSYRVDYSTSTIEEITTTRKSEKKVDTPKVDVRKYLASLLTPRLREEFLSRVDNIKNNAEVFAHFLVLCREYGLIFDFNRIRERLGISKISLRKARKKIVLTSWTRTYVDRVFFEIADKIEKKYWLSAVLLTIEFQRRQEKVDIKKLKEHLHVEIPKTNGYIIYRLLNEKNTVVLVYPYFAYLKCPHGLPAKIDYTKKYLFVRHLGGKKKHDYCFTVTTKNVEKILQIMDYHYEAVNHSKKNELQLSEFN